MRNFIKLFGNLNRACRRQAKVPLLIIALVAVIGFTMAACDTGNGPDPDPQPSTPQSVTYVSSDDDGNLYTLEITENTGRSARYTAKNGDSFKFTVELFKDGNFNVALTYSGTIESAEGSGAEIVISITVNGKPLTITISGATMTVISGDIVDEAGETVVEAPANLTVLDTPEKLPVQKRWSKWRADDAIATLNYSVASDGVCTITVSGRAQPNNATDDWGRWKANAYYQYTAEANTRYKYEFEAWTQSGERTLNLQYYLYWPEKIYFGEELTINTTRKTYTVWGEVIPYTWGSSMEFQCADKLGTFYVKVLSITPLLPPEELPLAERWFAWKDDTSTATVDHLVDNEDVCKITVKGTAEPDWDRWKAGAQYYYTAKANTRYEYKFEAWTESGERTLTFQYYNETPESVWLNKELKISTKQTYTILGENIPKDGIRQGVRSMEFQCADQLGTFYVKVLSITPTQP